MAKELKTTSYEEALNKWKENKEKLVKQYAEDKAADQILKGITTFTNAFNKYIHAGKQPLVPQTDWNSVFNQRFKEYQQGLGVAEAEYQKEVRGIDEDTRKSELGGKQELQAAKQRIIKLAADLKEARAERQEDREIQRLDLAHSREGRAKQKEIDRIYKKLEQSYVGKIAGGKRLLSPWVKDNVGGWDGEVEGDKYTQLVNNIALETGKSTDEVQEALPLSEFKKAGRSEEKVAEVIKTGLLVLKQSNLSKPAGPDEEIQQTDIYGN